MFKLNHYEAIGISLTILSPVLVCIKSHNSCMAYLACCCLCLGIGILNISSMKAVKIRNLRGYWAKNSEFHLISAAMMLFFLLAGGMEVALTVIMLLTPLWIVWCMPYWMRFYPKSI